MNSYISLSAAACILLLVSALVLQSSCSKRNRASQVTSFTANADNGKEIIVRGLSNEELARILSDFKEIYKDRGIRDHPLKINPLGNNTIRITFPQDFPPIIFTYLINYLQYPKGFDLKAHSIAVYGTVVLSTDFLLPDQNLVGQKSVFYIPANDHDYDLVYIRVGDQTFEDSFVTNNWRKVTDPRIPSGIDLPK